MLTCHHAGHDYEVTALGGDGRYSVVCLNPALDDAGIDQTADLPAAVVGEWCGERVEFFAVGEALSGVETVYRRVPTIAALDAIYQEAPAGTQAEQEALADIAAAYASRLVLQARARPLRRGVRVDYAQIEAHFGRKIETMIGLQVEVEFASLGMFCLPAVFLGVGEDSDRRLCVYVRLRDGFIAGYHYSRVVV